MVAVPDLRKKGLKPKIVGVNVGFGTVLQWVT